MADPNDDWPKNPDGTPKRLGDMTPAEQAFVWRRAGEIAAEQTFAREQAAEARGRVKH